MKHLLYIYDDNSDLEETIKESSLFEDIFFNYTHIDEFLKNPNRYIKQDSVLLLHLEDSFFNDIFKIAIPHELTISFLPKKNQKNITNTYKLEKSLDLQFKNIVESKEHSVDIICIDNRSYILNEIAFGEIPIFNSIQKQTIKDGFFSKSLHVIKRFLTITFNKVEITTDNEKRIVTAASGFIVSNHNHSKITKNLYSLKQSIRDGNIMLILISPFSLFEYIHFVVKLLFYSSNHALPNAIGYVKSKSLTIKSSLKDENSMPLEFTCRVLENKLKLIAGDEFWEENQQHSETKESVKVDNLPDKDEISRYISSKIPIVAYASEERFKDLFMSLKEESKLTSSYVIFIILSTLLASIGLLVNSAAVIIGAMILAPLMAPIVSFSMGLLRSQKALIYDSLKTILIGIVLALGASYLFSLAIPFTELTSQMQGRIHPSLLDLGVAILSGVAAAYAKSYKEIAQNLAGVAIAVALVPPLATSGIGLGRGDFLMFYQAFLLFFTNLVGISLAATVTFLFLGYSNALKNKLGFSLVFTTLLVISIPLYLSYKQIASTQQHIEKLTHTRFIVNSKYVIINSATIDKHEKYTTVDLSLFSRENLDRYDLEKLKEKIEHYYGNNLQIRVKIEYIL